MIKAAFFDIDGTLFSHKSGCVPASTIQALELLKEKNILRILATGRHHLEMEELPLRQLDLDGYVLLTGQLCCDRDLVPFYDSPFPEATMEVILQAFHSQTLPLILVEQDRIYINRVTEDVLSAQEELTLPPPEIGEYQGAPLYQLVAYGTPEETDALMERLPGCKAMRWHPLSVDIIPEQGGKMLGIQKMLEHIHCAPEEIIAFGDGENDTDMLKYAGIGVAMGNADDFVKEHADFVTKDIDDDGILYALQELGIL